MERIGHTRPSAALVVSVLALFVAIGGTAVAVTKAPKNSVVSKSIKNGEVKTGDISNKKGVKSKDIVDGEVGSAEIAGGAITNPKLAGNAVNSGKVANDSLTGQDIDESSLGAVPTVAELEVFGDSWTRATPSSTDDDPAVARANATEIALAKKGQLDVYAKCFRDGDDQQTHAEVYIRTSVAGSIFSSRGADNKKGGNTASSFLNPDTLETDRQLLTGVASNTNAALQGDDEEDFHAYALDGTQLEGQLSLGVKSGANLGEGNGVYGEGDACLFGGFVIG